MMFFVSLLVGILSVNAENQGVYIETSWNNGFKGYIRLAPSVDLNGWKIYVIFNNPVGTLQVKFICITHANFIFLNNFTYCV